MHLTISVGTQYDTLVRQEVSYEGDVKAARESTSELSETLHEWLLEIKESLERDPCLNPTPPENPCCDKFEAWAKTQSKSAGLTMCPFCAIPITKERADKFFVEKEEF